MSSGGAYFSSDLHALVTGWILGCLMDEARLSTLEVVSEVDPIQDAEGNYKPTMKVTAHDGTVFMLTVTQEAD